MSWIGTLSDISFKERREEGGGPGRGDTLDKALWLDKSHFWALVFRGKRYRKRDSCSLLPSCPCPKASSATNSHMCSLLNHSVPLNVMILLRGRLLC